MPCLPGFHPGPRRWTCNRSYLGHHLLGLLCRFDGMKKVFESGRAVFSENACDRMLFAACPRPTRKLALAGARTKPQQL